MQHHHRAGGQAVQAFLHGREIHAVGGSVVVRVVLDREAGVFEQGAVVLPARVADPHVVGGAELAQEVRAQFQAAGTAQRLHGHGALLGDDRAVGAQQQALHGRVVGGKTVDRQVGLGRAHLQQLFLGGAHAGQQGHLAVVVVIHAHAQVHLVGVLVSHIGFSHAQDRVLGGEFDVGEYGGGHGSVHGGLRRLKRERRRGQGNLSILPQAGAFSATFGALRRAV